MHDKELRAVLELDPSHRYTYFIKKVADWGELWTLESAEGWPVAGDAEGSVYFPVWPHDRYAVLCVGGPWAGCHPSAISVDEWLEHWIPGFIANQQMIAVFPTPAMNGVPVTPDRLEKDLRAELSLYE